MMPVEGYKYKKKGRAEGGEQGGDLSMKLVAGDAWTEK
jgi:hypothetical protein